jgi:hypothetical protein
MTTGPTTKQRRDPPRLARAVANVSSRRVAELAYVGDAVRDAARSKELM